MVDIIRLIVIVMYAVNICEVLYLLLNMTHIGSLSTQPSLRVVLSRAQHARSLLAGCYKGRQPPLGQEDIHNIHPYPTTSNNHTGIDWVHFLQSKQQVPPSKAERQKQATIGAHDFSRQVMSNSK